MAGSLGVARNLKVHSVIGSVKDVKRERWKSGNSLEMSLVSVGLQLRSTCSVTGVAVGAGGSGAKSR